MSAAGLGERLRQARVWAGYSQQEAADALGIPRELISYWENERRTPSFAQLTELAAVYDTTTGYLLGYEAASGLADEHALLYRDLPAWAPRTRAGVRRWLAFLDDWADLLEDVGDPLPGRAIPPKRAWRAKNAMTDLRSARRLADEVRDHYDLGDDAIPDLVAFLDQIGVLVYRAPLEPIEDGGVSGAFYNHRRLGYCILVNTHTTAGRQLFTLAHEFAHALFHYRETGVVSRADARDARERFADAFASYFLVPTGGLRRLVERDHGGVLGPFEVVRLQRYFRVSYAMMLYRLRNEGLLTLEQFDEYKQYSPSQLARQLGYDARDYMSFPEATEISLGTYPVSVLERVRSLVRSDDLSPPAAASLLRVSQDVIFDSLLASPQPAAPDELREFDELREAQALAAGRRTPY